MRGKATLCEKVRRISKVPPEGLADSRISAEKQVMCTRDGANSGAPLETVSKITQSGEVATDVSQWLRACPVALDEKQRQLITLIVGEFAGQSAQTREYRRE